MKNIAANQTATLNLVRIAQTSDRETMRANAINLLWDLYCDQVTGVSSAYSYKLDSDHSLRGMSPANRDRNIKSSTYLMFRQAVMSFDPTLNVPFMAYVSKNSFYQQKSEKRKNAKHSGREIPVDFSACYGKRGDDDQESAELSILRKLRSNDRFWEEVDLKDAIDSIMHYLDKNGETKLLHYFCTSYKVCQEYGDYKDAAVASILGCTRANVGVLRKRLCRVLKQAGLEEDCRLVFQAMAA